MQLPPSGFPPMTDIYPYLIIDAGIDDAPAADQERRLSRRGSHRRGGFGRQNSKRGRKGDQRCAGNESATIDVHPAAPFLLSNETSTKGDNWKAGVLPQRLAAFAEISLATPVWPASTAIV